MFEPLLIVKEVLMFWLPVVFALELLLFAPVSEEALSVDLDPFDRVDLFLLPDVLPSGLFFEDSFEILCLATTFIRLLVEAPVVK